MLRKQLLTFLASLREKIISFNEKLITVEADWERDGSVVRKLSIYKTFFHSSNVKRHQ